MPKCADCLNCKTLVDLTGNPILCHICPKDHILCERCNDIARGYCLNCGEKTVRMEPGIDLHNLYKVPTDVFMRKLADSCTLVMSDEDGDQSEYTCGGSGEATIIGFKKWPRSFFHKIPNESSSTLEQNEQQFLELLPNIVEYEDESAKSLVSSNWDNFPKDFGDFKMFYKIMQCPITKCAYPLCNSDVTSHLLQSHEYLPIEALRRYGMGNFTVQNTSLRKNEVTGLMRILVSGVIRGLGNTKFKDYLPLYLLCTRVNILEAEGKTVDVLDNGASASSSTLESLEDFLESDADSDANYASSNPWQSSDCILIWCGGIVPLDYTIRMGISVYPEDDLVKNLGAVVKVLPMQLPQTSDEIFKNTNRLMITATDVVSFSNKKNIFCGQIRIM